MTPPTLQSIQSLLPRRRRGPGAPADQPAERSADTPVRTDRSDRSDRIARGVILGGGVFVLALLAWGHLGLGALLFPPAATAGRQTAHAGPYVVELVMASGQLTARGPNTILVVVRDAHGQPVEHARIQIAAGMTSMPMAAPMLTGADQGQGRYLAHPLFGMAGPWQFDIIVSVPGQPAHHAPFNVGVRWS